MGHSVLCRGARDSLSPCLLQFRAKVTGIGLEESAFGNKGVQAAQKVQEIREED
jgi:hypothetical protein